MGRSKDFLEDKKNFKIFVLEPPGAALKIQYQCEMKLPLEANMQQTALGQDASIKRYEDFSDSNFDTCQKLVITKTINELMI